MIAILLPVNEIDTTVTAEMERYDSKGEVKGLRLVFSLNITKNE